MNKLSVFLEQLDLSEIEASLYTGLLDNGPMSVRDLAVFTKMKRTTAYFYIDQLIEKGLVVKLTRGTQKLVTVSMPKDSLQYLVEQKEKQAQKLKAEFPAILNALKTTLPEIAPNNDSEITYYKGTNGVKKVYEAALKAKELRLYVKLFETAKLFENDKNIFENALLQNKELTIREIIADIPEDIQHISLPTQSGRYHYRFMPSDIGLAAANMLIYDNTVAIINVTGTITTIVLDNNDYFINSKKLFDYIWETLAEVK